MIEKTKNILTILLFVIFVVCIVYSIFQLIASNFIEKDLITSEEVALYAIDGNLVTNYSNYYYFENCLQNLVEGCKQSKYNELYNLYMKDYKKQYEKQEILTKLEQFNTDNVSLKNIYKANNIYILQIELDNQVQYLLMNFGATKNTSYEFAFIK